MCSKVPDISSASQSQKSSFSFHNQINLVLENRVANCRHTFNASETRFRETEKRLESGRRRGFESRYRWLFEDFHALQLKAFNSAIAKSVMSLLVLIF